MIVLITDHFSTSVKSPPNSAEISKFRRKGQIRLICSKFRGARKTVGPKCDYFSERSVKK